MIVLFLQVFTANACVTSLSKALILCSLLKYINLYSILNVLVGRFSAVPNAVNPPFSQKSEKENLGGILSFQLGLHLHKISFVLCYLQQTFCPVFLKITTNILAVEGIPF